MYKQNISLCILTNIISAKRDILRPNFHYFIMLNMPQRKQNKHRYPSYLNCFMVLSFSGSILQLRGAVTETDLYG